MEGTYEQTSGMKKSSKHPEFKIEADHFSLVKRTAFHLKSRVPPNVDLDDLIQAGLEGLVQASRSYDPAKNVTFEGFAKVRIKGAMLDEVRRLSYATRTTVSLKREQSEAIEHLANLQGKTYKRRSSWLSGERYKFLRKGETNCSGKRDTLFRL